MCNVSCEDAQIDSMMFLMFKVYFSILQYFVQTLIRGETSYRLLFKDVRVDWKEIKFPLFHRTNICSIRYARNMEIFRGSRTGQKNLFVGDCDANDDDRHNAAVRWGGQWLERGLISIDPHSGHYSTNLQFPDEHAIHFPWMFLQNFLTWRTSVCMKLCS